MAASLSKSKLLTRGKEVKVLCCFCGNEITPLYEGQDPEIRGNNPYPASNNQNDRCCDKCNEAIVIPARLTLMYAN